MRRKQIEDAKLSLVVRETTNAVVITDENGLAEWANEGFTRISGYLPEEIYGKKPGDILQGADTDPSTVAFMHSRLKAKQGFDVEILNYSKSGRPYWLSINCQPVHSDTEPLKFIAVQSDITQQKESERLLEASRERLERQLDETRAANAKIEKQAAELRQLAESERELRNKAEAGERTKSEFLASMSHEIRTPMTGVMGFADMLLEDNLAPESEKKVLQIKESTNSLLRIINDILDISKLEAGKLEIENVAFDPRDLINDVVGMFQHTLPKERQQALAIDCQIDDSVPVAMKSDPTRLRQIMINLVGNAVKFTSEGTVLISARSERDGDRCLLAIDVTDTGIGMSKDVVSKLFVPFTQGDSSISRKYQGTGLGLSICQRLITLMHGTIDVSSSPGQGTTFSFAIPYENADTAQVGPTEPRSLSARTPLRELRILVAEDNELNQTIIDAVLKKLNHQPVLTGNGAEALATLKEQDFDLILMDIRMPVMSGVEAARAIRAMPGTKGQIPIIALTADVMTDSKTEYKAVGINQIVPKPIDRNKLIAAIEFAMGAAGAVEESSGIVNAPVA